MQKHERQVFAAAKDLLDRVGATDVRLERGSHSKIRYRYRGISGLYIVSSSAGLGKDALPSMMHGLKRAINARVRQIDNMQNRT